MWTLFSKEIFTVFWQLELQDITKPDEIYSDYMGEAAHTPAEARRIKSLKADIKALDEMQKKGYQSGDGNHNDKNAEDNKYLIEERQRLVD